MSCLIDLLKLLEGRKIPPHTDISEYLNVVARHDSLTSEPETLKNNSEAVKHRNLGNRDYLEKRFDDALWQYNQSICFAENQSEHLGIGYANRSAVYYERGEYEFALYNIDLARKHNYPEKLLPKLAARETNCKERIAGGHSYGNVPLPIVDINVDVNPKIPFLAKGVGMKLYEKMGRGLVAERDFTTGDVILDEKTDLCYVSFGKRCYFSCSHCGSIFEKSLIPCPSCVAVMYCGEECRKADFRATHRFECSVVTRLEKVTGTNMMIMAKLFFYGLTAFNDDINQMMKYCKQNAAVGSNPLNLDLTNPNPLGVFKALHQFKPNLDHDDSSLEQDLKFSASALYLVFMQSPQVQQIVRTKAQRNFMLRCLLIHGRVASQLAVNQGNHQEGCLAILSPFVSLMNLSCDPNVTAQIDSGRIKIIVLRPIRKGEQITNSCGSAWWELNDGAKFDFECACVVCDRGPKGVQWRNARDNVPMISLRAVNELAENDPYTFPALVQFQRTVQILARDGQHPGELFGVALSNYNDALYDTVRVENAKLNRGKLLQNDGN